MDKPLYTIPEVAKLFQINKKTAYDLCRTGQLKCLKLGSLKVRAEEVERFLRESEGLDISDPFHIRTLKDSSSRIEKAPR